MNFFTKPRAGHAAASPRAQMVLPSILSVTDQIEGNTICALGDAAAWPTRGFAKKFRDEFLQHIREKRCPLGGGSLH